LDSLYDDMGNDLLQMTPTTHTPTPTFNDNCVALGLTIYNNYAIANVALSPHWRVYPNDDNLQRLKTLVGDTHLHFHYR